MLPWAANASDNAAPPRICSSTSPSTALSRAEAARLPSIEMACRIGIPARTNAASCWLNRRKSFAFTRGWPPAPPNRVRTVTPLVFGGVTLKTLKPSRSSRARASIKPGASTVRVTISPAGVPNRQINSAIVSESAIQSDSKYNMRSPGGLTAASALCVHASSARKLQE